MKLKSTYYIREVKCLI